MTTDGFAEHLAEIGGYGEVAAFVEMFGLQPGPASVDFAAFDRASENEHDIGVAVAGAAVTILPRRASEFRHGDDDGCSAEVAEAGPGCAARLRQLPAAVGILS